MRILYIDCWSPPGHLQFNKIHLKSLSQIGDVGVIFRENAFKILDIHNVHRVMELSDHYFENHEGSLNIRLSMARMMRSIWNKINSKEWDHIILASYDPMALFLSCKFKRSMVIDHNTIADLDNPIKGFCLRHLSSNIKHIVFNEIMMSKLLKNGIDNCAIVPHGFFPMNDRKWSDEEIKNKKEFYEIKEYQNFIFIPSLSTGCEDLIDQYVYNIGFNDFLKENNLVLLTKSKIKRTSMSNIHIIQGRLPQENYEFLFKHSVCNILLYSPTFKYRTSGVLNECFANNVPCIMNNNSALLAYKGYINNEHCSFSNSEEMKESILSVLHWDKSISYYGKIYEIADPLESWKKLLSN